MTESFDASVKSASGFERHLSPEPALPSQFYDLWHRTRAINPSRALALAVLDRAIQDIQTYRDDGRPDLRRAYEDACAWVESDERRWPFSFLNLCSLFDLSAAAVRQVLLGGGEHRARAA